MGIEEDRDVVLFGDPETVLNDSLSETHGRRTGVVYLKASRESVVEVRKLYRTRELAVPLLPQDGSTEPVLFPALMDIKEVRSRPQPHARER